MKTDNAMVNAFVPGAADLTPEEQAMVERRQRQLGPAYRLFYERPVEIVRGKGVWLYDKRGEAYLDVYNNVAGKFRADVEAAIADLRRHGIKPAALIADTIFSSDGVMSEQPGFLKSAVKAIRAAGGVSIADEVQPGFGRTGDHMWGFERHDVVPDLVTLGKPIWAMAIRSQAS